MDSRVLIDIRSRRINGSRVLVDFIGVFHVVWTLICSQFLVGLTLFRHRFNV